MHIGAYLYRNAYTKRCRRAAEMQNLLCVTLCSPVTLLLSLGDVLLSG